MGESTAFFFLWFNITGILIISYLEMDDSHKWQFSLHNRSLHLPAFICRSMVSYLLPYTLKTTFWELFNTHNRLYIYHIFFNLDFIYSLPLSFQSNSHSQTLNSFNFFLIFFLFLPKSLYHLLNRRYRELQLLFLLRFFCLQNS